MGRVVGRSKGRRLSYTTFDQDLVLNDASMVYLSIEAHLLTSIVSSACVAWMYVAMKSFWDHDVVYCVRTTYLLLSYGVFERKDVQQVLLSNSGI